MWEDDAMNIERYMGSAGGDVSMGIDDMTVVDATDEGGVQSFNLEWRTPAQQSTARPLDTSMEIDEKNGVPFLTLTDYSLSTRAIAGLIDKGYKLDLCETVMSGATINAKASASDTSVFFTNLSTKKAAMKIFLDPPPENNSLQVEVMIYKFIVTPLLADNHTPCLIAFLGFSRCKNFLNNLELTLDGHHELTAQMHHLKQLSRQWRPTNPIISNTINVLALEKAENARTLQSFLVRVPRPDPEVIKEILFMLLFTLLNFDQLKLRHNDLHTSNIFVQELPGQARSMRCFTTPQGNSWYVRGTYLPLIYDFDHGAVDDIRFPLNTLLTKHRICMQYGECNRRNPKFDAFKLICNINMTMTRADYNHDQLQEFLEFVGSCFSRDLLRLHGVTMRRTGCNLVRTTTNKDKLVAGAEWDNVVWGDYLPPDGPNNLRYWMLPLKAMLENKYFDSLRVNKFPDSPLIATHTLITREQVNTLLNKVTPL